MRKHTLRRWSRALIMSAAAVATAGLLAPSASAEPRSLQAICEDPAAADYDDRDQISSAHVTAVDCLSELGVVQGYDDEGGNEYRPAGEVTRAQMATFVARMLTEAGVDLPVASDQGFEDVDDDGTHTEAIRQLAELGIVQGVTEDEYQPARRVDRAQMASYLIRALAHEAGVEVADYQAGEHPFTDVSNDSAHAPNIRGAYQLGITTGVDEDSYVPASTVDRAPMASFVARTLDAMVAQQTVLDVDQGAFQHTVYTSLTEGGRCFDVTAGEAWETRCDPATDETLQLYEIPVADDFTVVAGLVTDDATRVEVEFGDGETQQVELVATNSANLRAWASAVLGEDIDAVVAYDGDTEVARETPSA